MSLIFRLSRSLPWWIEYSLLNVLCSDFYSGPAQFFSGTGWHHFGVAGWLNSALYSFAQPTELTAIAFLLCFMRCYISFSVMYNSSQTHHIFEPLPTAPGVGSLSLLTSPQQSGECLQFAYGANCSIYLIFSFPHSELCIVRHNCWFSHSVFYLIIFDHSTTFASFVLIFAVFSAIFMLLFLLLPRFEPSSFW